MRRFIERSRTICTRSEGVDVDPVVLLYLLADGVGRGARHGVLAFPCRGGLVDADDVFCFGVVPPAGIQGGCELRARSCAFALEAGPQFASLLVLGCCG